MRITADELHRAATNVRPFAPAAMELLSTCNDVNAESRDVVRIIEYDPGIAARILQLANSSSYGLSGRIRSIDHAVIALGFREIADVAMTTAAARMFSEGETVESERQGLWHHSLACAVIARQLAIRQQSPHFGEAFLAGLFHDVGKLLLLETEGADYTGLVESTSQASSIERELEFYGTTHQEIGQRCATTWGLRTEIIHAIGHHHFPEKSPADYELVELTSTANRLAKAWQLNENAPHHQAADETCEETTEDDLKVREQIYDAVKSEFEEAIALCTP